MVDEREGVGWLFVVSSTRVCRNYSEFLWQDSEMCGLRTPIKFRSLLRGRPSMVVLSRVSNGRKYARVDEIQLELTEREKRQSVQSTCCDKCT